MSSDSWPDDLPPPLDLASVAEGASPQGVRWEIQAGGTPDECVTLLHIVLPDGRGTGGGGHGGPALPADQPLSFSVHQADPGVHYFVGRVDPAVARVRVEFVQADQPALDLRPAGYSPDLGVAFVAAILPPAADVGSVTAWTASGRRIGAEQASRHRTSRDRRADGPFDG